MLARLTSDAGSGRAILGSIMWPVIVLPLHVAVPSKALHSILRFCSGRPI